jgi:uncharacterized membrane protein YgcG
MTARLGDGMRSFDFSSWQALLTTLAGIALFALVGIGIRMLVMFTVQQRRERLNRQINERLKTLIAAYKVLGGSFTGNLTVDPAHLKDIHKAAAEAEAAEPADGDEPPGSDRRRRIRDAVEAALADIILLGTEEQVRLAGRAASELAAGRPVHMHELVVSLRNYVREALDLEPVPADAGIPHQGPTRPSGSGGGGRSGGRGGEAGGGGRGGGGGGMGGGGGSGGMGMGLGGGSDDTIAGGRT